MTLLRHAKKRDANEPQIVRDLRAVGVKVWLMDQPCDLLTLYRGRWQPLEVKAVDANLKRKDQQDQHDFIASTGVPVVQNSLQALQALGVFAK